MGKITMTVDGNTAAAYVAYAFTDVAAVYPITPSSAMAETVDEWAANGRKNIFGQTVKVVQMQSEAGASGAFHGSLQAGALTTTFTASQGLLLMIPNMYKVSGELLPGVFHVSARALAAQALNIFGDHQDVMAARQTGCAMLASGSVQEVMDLAPIAHAAALRGRLPFLHFFDGFRTSHEVQKVEAPAYEELAGLVDWEALRQFRARALSPNHPVMRGTAQNPDIYFQTREACNPFYENIVPIVEDYMKRIGALTGRRYGLFDYYGAADAEYVVVAIGSVCGTIEETVDYCNARGEKYGLVKVHLFRPFSVGHFRSAMPQSVKRIAVLDRTKEPGAPGEPLYLDVRSSFYGTENAPLIIGGRFGLGSKDTTPADIKAVYDNLKSDAPKQGFTVGVCDDVTHTSLPLGGEKIVPVKEGVVRCKFWGLGSDGTVGANKQAVKIIGEHTDKYVQAYFAYDSRKSGGLTTSHLRFGDRPIRSAYLIDEADYIACHNQSYVNTYDLLKGIRQGGTFVLNCMWGDSELDEKLPPAMRRAIAQKGLSFYTVDAVKIAEEIGLGNRINMIMQGAFFKLTAILPEEEAQGYLKEAVKKAYGKKGDKVVRMNMEAIERGFGSLHKVSVPERWRELPEEETAVTGDSAVKEPAFIRDIMRPMNRQEGDRLPVSAFSGMEDGTFPCGTTAYEKRGIAVNVPEWNVETCIQCNQCSFICPHATIRPFLLTAEEKAAAPQAFLTQQAKGKGLEGYAFRMQVAPMDCTGCGNCADICPATPKALVMRRLGTQTGTEVPNWEYAVSRVSDKSASAGGRTLKGSQFFQPLMEFSGACAGCGEPAYIRLVTQLFGERMMIANATGCSSIWGASAPSMAYTCTAEGKGPSWANSLFEDNAEYGYGMFLGVRQMRDHIEDVMRELIACGVSGQLQEAFENWIRTREDGQQSQKASREAAELLQRTHFEDDKRQALLADLLEHQDYLAKRSFWLVGGDGWAYDIGYAGLDHVMASGEDVNALVFDTEIYSNTGGQASKSTPAAAVAKFAASGKKSGKKDLGRMMMAYRNIYVAQVAMGADKNQTLKAILEAESYPGPSLIIAYAPCISHGIKEGMGRSMHNMAQAVAAGYWHLYRYNPLLLREGKNPFTLDSGEPTGDFHEFLMGQVRYSALARQFPEQAEELFEKTRQDAAYRYEEYKRLARG